MRADTAARSVPYHATSFESRDAHQGRERAARHATPAFTMATYRHELPGMQAEAVRTFAAILDPSTGPTGWNRR